MKTNPCLSRSDAASIALKPLNTLALARHCSQRSGHRPFAWADVPSMTELTSISGLMTISPEGGP